MFDKSTAITIRADLNLKMFSLQTMCIIHLLFGPYTIARNCFNIFKIFLKYICNTFSY